MVIDVKQSTTLTDDGRGLPRGTGEPLTIVYAVDAAYWSHTCVSIRSLIENNHDLHLDIRILAKQPDEEFFRQVPGIVGEHKNATISWLPVHQDQLNSFTSSISYITTATYYRLILDQLLPETVRRVLYIDGDTVIRKSLRGLLAVDISSVVMAAVPEYGAVPHNARLGIPDELPCFNAGVLYINLDMWREHEIGQHCIRYIQDNIGNPEKLRYNDQDALNAVLVRQWKAIGPSYNYSPWTLDERRLDDFDVYTQPGGIIPSDGPVVAHYAGPVKPWQGGSLHPFEADYWRYRSRTPYADRVLRVRCALTGSPRQARHLAIMAVRRAPGGTRLLGYLRRSFFPR